MKSTTDATLPIIFTDDGQEYLFSDGNMTIRDETMEEALQNIIFESASTESTVMPQEKTNEMHVPSPSFSLPVNMFDDFMTDIDYYGDDIFQPILGDYTWNDHPFQDDDLLMLFNDDTLAQEQSQVMSDDIAAPHSEPVSTISPIIPSATIDEMHVPTTNSSMQLNLHGDIMPANDDDFFQSMLGEDDTWRDVFQLLEDQLIPSDDTQGQEETQVQRENITATVQSVTNVTTSPIGLIPTNSSQNLNISITPGLLPQPCVFNTGEGSSQRPVAQALGGNMGVVNPISSPENCSNISNAGEGSSPIGMIPNSSQNLNISFTPELLPQPCIFNAGDGSSQRPVAQALGGNMGVVNPISSSENCSNISNAGEGSSPIGLIPTNSSQNLNISITPGFLPQPCIFNTVEGSSQRPVAQALGGNMGVVNPIPSSENCSNISNAGAGSSPIGLISNSSQNLNISIPGLLPQLCNFTAGEGSSQRPVAQALGGNMGVVNQIPSSENCSNISNAGVGSSPIGLVPNSSQNLNISFTPGLLPQPCFFNAGDGSSQRTVAQALGGNMGVVNPIPTSENCSNISNAGAGSSPIGLIPTNSCQNLNISVTPGLLPQPCIFNAGDVSSQRPVAQALGGNMGLVNPIPSSENCSNISNAGVGSSPIGLIQTNSSQNLNIPITPGLLPQPCIFNAGEGSSQRPVAQALGVNMGVLNPIPSSENCSNISNLPLTQNNSNLWPAIPNSWFQPSGMNSSTNGSGTTDPHGPPPVLFSFGNSMFFTATGNGSVTPFQPCLSPNFPMLPYASSSNSHHQQFQNFGAATWVSPMLTTPLDHTLQQNQTLSLKTQLERGLTQLPRDIASQSLLTNGYSKEVAQDLRGNVGGVMNPILRSQSYPNSPLSLPQNNANPWLHPTTGSSSSCSNQQQQFARSNWLEMSGNTSLSTLANAMMGPNAWIPRQYNIQRPFRPQPPTFKDFPEFEQAWKGCVVAKIQSNRSSLNQAKAFKRPSSPDTLTANWSSSLEIALFLPKKAVSHTTRICDGPIDYMFFHLTRFNNLHLYEHLMSRSLCAKIDLTTQTVILSPSESKFHFVGTIFPRATVFVEPVYLDIEAPFSRK